MSEGRWFGILTYHSTTGEKGKTDIESKDAFWMEEKAINNEITARF